MMINKNEHKKADRDSNALIWYPDEKWMCAHAQQNMWQNTEHD